LPVLGVDVKPERMLADPGVSAALDWAGRVSAAKGWRFEVWSRADVVDPALGRGLAKGPGVDGERVEPHPGST
jgi:hypothetical protein